MWEAPQCADSGEPLIERPLQDLLTQNVKNLKPETRRSSTGALLQRIGSSMEEGYRLSW